MFGLTWSSQNLNEKKGEIVGSIFGHGRGWLRWKKSYNEITHIEWLFGKHAKGFALTTSFHDDDCGVCLHICLPWLFSFYWTFSQSIIKCKNPIQNGIAIYNNGFWMYIWSNMHESNSSDPWYRKTHCWDFPWVYDWYSTEILEHKANLPYLAKTIYMESKGNRPDFSASYEIRKKAESHASETYDYVYTRNNGEVQNRKATVYVNRYTRKMKWFPIKKSSTSIHIEFDEEVGERTGSWKGGVLGCGCEMKYGETPLQTLRRMEVERKFD